MRGDEIDILRDFSEDIAKFGWRSSSVIATIIMIIAKCL